MVLCWHVPYWDRLGWKDPFGDERHTARQRRYQKALKLRGLQTPHVFVGNQPVRTAAEIKPRIEAGAKESPKLELQEGRARLVGDKVEVTAKLKRLDKEFEFGKEITVQAVLFQRKVSTECTAGENEGRTLHEFFVVVASADPVRTTHPMNKGIGFKLTAPKEVKADDLGVALLVERPDKMQTIECWQLPVTLTR